jgi:phage host-nuclease inhibitor protein Gam
MSKRKVEPPKTFVPPIETVEGLNARANQLVEMSTQLAEHKAARDKRIAEINTEFDAEHRDLMQEIDAITTSCHLYCSAHPEIFAPKKRSLEFGNATVGFRTNPPKVEMLHKKDTWENVAFRIQAQPWGEPYVRETIECKKDSLIADRKTLTPEQLRTVGIDITQGETFFIAPNNQSAAPVAI